MPEPTDARAELAGLLRLMREKSGLSIDAVADEVGIATWTYLRMEHATALYRPGDVFFLAHIFGVDKKTRDILMQLTRRIRATRRQSRRQSPV
jgi:hypothetical protein